MFSLQEILSATLVLIPIIDIVGSIPLILGIRERGEVIKPFQVCIIALIFLIGFLFAGEGILRLFKVDLESFAVAGALILFVYALEMILDVDINKNKGPEGSGSIVPIAFPLVAGPASFTTLLSIRAEYALINVIIAVVINLIIVYVVLAATDLIEKILGKAVIYILRKIFGIILLAISVKLFASNIGNLI